MNANSTGKIVSSTLDLDRPRLPTSDEAAQLQRLDDLRDEDIDFSDLPPAAQETIWSRPGNFREVIAKRVEDSKQQRLEPTPERFPIEADALQFFRETGDASPTRINAALREYVATHRKSA